MSQIFEIPVPDIGDFDEVDIVEVLVSPGDTVAVDQSLVTLESDKASMEIPSPRAGTIREVRVQVGDRASEGTILATLETEDAAAEETYAATQAAGGPPQASPGAAPSAGAKAVAEAGSGLPQGSSAAAPSTAGEDASTSRRGGSAGASDPAPETSMRAPVPGGSPEPAGAEPSSSPSPTASDEDRAKADLHSPLLVLGAGPGGYTAAFRAADLGQEVVLVERYPDLGGVCLNVGCIPSKALLHAAKVLDEADSFADHGIRFGKPKIDLGDLRSWKDGVVKRLTGGLATLAKQRKVRVVEGLGKFLSPHRLEVETPEGPKQISFDQCIVAAGSRVVKLPFIPWDDPRVLDSTDALELARIPERLLVLGGGIIGLEMATVYHALGSAITVVELLDGLIPGCDKDLVRPLQRRIAKLYENIFLSTKVTAVEATKKGLVVRFEGRDAPEEDTFDAVLVAVGRRPNGDVIGAEAAGLQVTDQGFIPVDRQQRTNVPHIFAIGDIVGQPMLAHKAIPEGKVAAEVAAGHKSSFDARVIPSVAYTDPEIAWVGLTEIEAKQRGIAYEKGSFPWAASGRSLAMGRDEGLTKVLFDPATDRVLGGGIAGPHAGDLVAELSLAIEMDCEAADLGLTIHPHPTLSETVSMAAEAFEGTLTDLYIPKRRKKKE